VVRVALAVEFVVTLISGVLYVIKPEWLVGPILPPTLKPEARDMMLEMCTWVGAFVLSQVVMIAFGLPDTQKGVAMRSVIYWTLLGGELFYTAAYSVFVHKLGMWSLDGSIPTVIIMLLLMLWRLYCLFVKPEWFGGARKQE